MSDAAVIVLGVIASLQTVIVVLMIVLRRDETRQILDLADHLARRVQAPQLAAVELANEQPIHAPPALIPDDDDAYWESREVLAERLMAEETSGSNS